MHQITETLTAWPCRACFFRLTCRQAKALTAPRCPLAEYPRPLAPRPPPDPPAAPTPPRQRRNPY